jgi:hypothetical protein
MVASSDVRQRKAGTAMAMQNNHGEVGLAVAAEVARRVIQV